jgi:hypothetical protein
LLQDETCFFLAVDSDKVGWREDAWRFSKPVTTSIVQPRSNDHGPGEARMSGSSSKKPFRPRSRDDSDRMTSPRHRNPAQPMIVVSDSGPLRFSNSGHPRRTQECPDQ